ncbi:gustatory and pheromone receptor 32a-like [Schistocerca serialis cubense]|uniref:gustatory and pheromone receptor 32a-like n=1 Tax=Schistocerca serialis cubense TaxID=2023355 RepID=UPI00214ED759|nr:gustatory and pheromone receptor 32a-like [Schistocerca serialis cubense]
MALELWVRLRSLNTCLLEMVLRSDLRVLLVAPQEAITTGRLSHLLEAFVALGRAAEVLEEHFGLLVATDIAQCVIGATCSAYELLIVISGLSSTKILIYNKSVSTSVLWLAYHCLKLAAIALSCAAFENAARRTGVILRRSPVLRSSFAGEVEAFLRVTSQDSLLRFTAAGFIEVDRRLLVSALAVVITYLVIIGQSAVN